MKEIITIEPGYEFNALVSYKAINEEFYITFTNRHPITLYARESDVCDYGKAPCTCLEQDMINYSPCMTCLDMYTNFMYNNYHYTGVLINNYKCTMDFHYDTLTPIPIDFQIHKTKGTVKFNDISLTSLYLFTIGVDMELITDSDYRLFDVIEHDLPIEDTDPDFIVEDEDKSDIDIFLEGEAKILNSNMKH